MPPCSAASAQRKRDDAAASSKFKQPWVRDATLFLRPQLEANGVTEKTMNEAPASVRQLEMFLFNYSKIQALDAFTGLTSAGLHALRIPGARVLVGLLFAGLGLWACAYAVGVRLTDFAEALHWGATLRRQHPECALRQRRAAHRPDWWAWQRQYPKAGTGHAKRSGRAGPIPKRSCPIPPTP